MLYGLTSARLPRVVVYEYVKGRLKSQTQDYTLLHPDVASLISATARSLRDSLFEPAPMYDIRVARRLLNRLDTLIVEGAHGMSAYRRAVEGDPALIGETHINGATVAHFGYTVVGRYAVGESVYVFFITEV